MWLLNFGPALTAAQIAAIEALAAQRVEKISGQPLPCDPQQAFAGLAGARLDDWLPAGPLLRQQDAWLNLPAQSIAAAVLLAELHGRLGYFPPLLTWPGTGAALNQPPCPAVMYLQAVRSAAHWRMYGRINP